MAQLHGPATTRTRRSAYAAYAAFGPADIDAAVADLHPEVEWIEPDEFPDGGRHVGREAARRRLERVAAQAARG